MMSQTVKPKFLWFRISIAFGLVLALLLLAQTVVTYRYVSRSLVRLEAQREADRRMQSIGRAARLTGSRESSTLTPILHELVHEAASQIAWIRILNFDGKVLAESEKTQGAPVYKPGELGRLLAIRDRHAPERDTTAGKIMIIVNPLRFGPPNFGRGPNDPAARIAQPPASSSSPQTAAEDPAGSEPDFEPSARQGRPSRGSGGGRSGPELAEIAIYLNGVSANFGPLQENLIVGCLAAFALMGANIVIGLRFRHYMRGKHMEEELSLARFARRASSVRREMRPRLSGRRRSVRCVRDGRR
jgi:hypothetical protein